MLEKICPADKALLFGEFNARVEMVYLIIADGKCDLRAKFIYDFFLCFLTNRFSS